VTAPRHIPRAGIGVDVHAFAPDRPLMLGGVQVPHHLGLAGHSDGDALIHAIVDALLGATARGDIGRWFPSDDHRFSGADSTTLLQTVVDSLRSEGWSIVNVDATIVAQQPRLSDHVDLMRTRLSGLLGIAVEDVSVKATTTDHLGALGRAEGIAAQAVAMLVRLVG
jgi:2-C-methyl-D-erythritol 2,4-cyclodiphosphate synthase